MSELTLSNFADLLDPDMIDKGKAFAGAGKLTTFQTSDDGIWRATFEEKKQALKVRVQFQGKQVSLIHCECAAHDDEGWADDPCVHAVAVLFGIKNGLPEKKIKAAPKSKEKETATEKAKKALEKPAKVKKDPALALLDTLESHDIVAFLTEVFSKNKEFKSQFMLYFAHSNTDNAEQYEVLIKQAISAVKGRKRYLAGAEASKITTALSPLYKQAAQAEAQGHLKQAITIVDSLLKPLTLLNDDIQTSSVKFHSFLVNCFNLRTQIVKNPAMPFDLKESIYQSFYLDYVTTYSGSEFEPLAYQNLVESARSLKRLDKIAELLEAARKKISESKISYWDIENSNLMHCIGRLIGLYDNDLETPEKADKVLGEHKDVLFINLMNVKRKIGQNKIDEALVILKEIDFNRKKYENQRYYIPNIEVIILSYYIRAYQTNGDTEALAGIAGERFVSTNCTNFQYYELEKQHRSESQWKERVKIYLKLTAPKPNKYANNTSVHFEILKREGMVEEMRNYIFNYGDLSLWNEYSNQLLEQFPQDYVTHLKTTIMKVLKSSGYNLQVQSQVTKMILQVAALPEYRDDMKAFVKTIPNEYRYNRLDKGPLKSLFND